MRAILAGVMLLAATPALAGPRTVVFFGEWSAALDKAAQASIAGAAQAALADRGPPITVIGAADTDGSTAANDLLSRLRAQVVKDALVADGVAAERITIRGIGGVTAAQTTQESRRASILIGQ